LLAQTYIPKPEQQKITNFILNHKRCGIFAAMGTGKTVSTLTALDILNLAGYNVFPVIIIAPLRVCKMVWPRETEKWKHIDHLITSVITGTERERDEALHKEADIYVINYENIPWLIQVLKGKWCFKTIISDELSKLKGFRLFQGTSRSKALAQVAFKSERFIGLTGTPASNGLKTLWGQIWFLDAGVRLGRSFNAFSQRWFTKTWDGWGLEPLPHAQKEIEEKISDICISIKLPGLAEPIKNIIEVILPEKVRKQYKQMEKEMYLELEGHNITAVHAAAKSQKLLQLTAGCMYAGNDNEKQVEVHDEKIKALEEVIEGAEGQPILVAYYFNSDLARLKKAFPQGRELDKNPKTEEDWNAGKIPVLFAHPKSAGHGLNLQHGSNILCFFSLNWDLEDHLQIIERIGPARQKQSGYDRPVYLHYLIAKDTVDEMVYKRLETKREVQDVLLEALKERRINNVK
jgi:SNF2 family DNA or RNA helicase